MHAYNIVALKSRKDTPRLKAFTMFTPLHFDPAIVYLSKESVTFKHTQTHITTHCDKFR